MASKKTRHMLTSTAKATTANPQESEEADFQLAAPLAGFKGSYPTATAIDTVDKVTTSTGDMESLLEQIRQLKAINSTLAKDNLNLKNNAVFLKSFKLFPKLPLELRRKIWNEALHIPESFTVAKGNWRWRMRIPAEWRILNALWKSNILRVSVEARTEAKNILTDWNIVDIDDIWDGCGKRKKSTKANGIWYNSITDFPVSRHPLDEIEAPFLSELNVKAIGIPYERWAGTTDVVGPHYPFSQRNHMYRSIGALHLQELYILVGPRELLVEYGNERVTTKSKPTAFMLHKDGKALATAGLTWKDMAMEEMRMMGEWEKKVIANREACIDAGVSEDALSLDHDMSLDITIPKITFRLEVQGDTFAQPR